MTAPFVLSVVSPHLSTSDGPINRAEGAFIHGEPHLLLKVDGEV